MPLGHSPHAPFNLRNISPVGYCDRCSFKYPLASLQPQQEWAGNTLVTWDLRVCPRCLDEPQPQKRTFHFTPDPAPLDHPRPGSLPQQVPQALQFILDDDEAGILDTDVLAPGGGAQIFGVYGTSVYDGGGEYG
jgi:hypothetical protein